MSPPDLRRSVQIICESQIADARLWIIVSRLRSCYRSILEMFSIQSFTRLELLCNEDIGGQHNLGHDVRQSSSRSRNLISVGPFLQITSHHHMSRSLRIILTRAIMDTTANIIITITTATNTTASTATRSTIRSPVSQSDCSFSRMQ